MNKKTILIKNASPAIPGVDFWRPYFEPFFNIERMAVNKKHRPYYHIDNKTIHHSVAEYYFNLINEQT